MPENLTNARIDQLPPSTGLKPYFPIAIRNMDNSVTEQINIGNFMASEQTQDFEWVFDQNYNENETVTKNGKLWQSTINGNVGITPGTNPGMLDPAPWIELNKSASGFVPYQPGGFVADDVYVLEDYDGYTQLFLLKNPTRPFISSDLIAEFTKGEWEIMSERGYLPVNKVAHGFPLGMNLTCTTADGWIECTGTTPPLGQVKTLEGADDFVLLLFGARVKEVVGGLTPGAKYYVQPDGSTGTDVSDKLIFVAIGVDEAILFTSGGSGGGSGGGGGSTVFTGRNLAFRFTSDLFTEQSLAIRGMITELAASLTNEITAVSYEVRLDSDVLYTPQANVADVQTWVDSNISGDELTGDIWWLKVIGMPSGLSEVLVKFNTGDGIAPPVSTAKDRQESFRFPSDVFDTTEIAVRGLIDNLSDGITDELDSIVYFTREDTGSYGGALTIADLQTWITTNVTGDELTGDIFWIKCQAVYKVGRSGEAENLFKFKTV